MNPRHLGWPAPGFTLVETMATLLVLSLVAITLSTFNGNLFQGRTALWQQELSTPLLQACAERVLALRRTEGFTASPAYDSACDAITGADTFDVSVTPNSTSPSCPNGATCQRVTIHVKSQGQTLGPVVIQWMNY